MTVTNGPTVSSRHYLALDGLRGVAALLVVLFHRRSWLGLERDWHGFLAVDFFYVLSGFVIAHAYGYRLTNGLMSFGKFAELRFVRLYPLIWLGAALGVSSIFIESAQTHNLWLGLRGLAALPFALLALPSPFLKYPFMPNEPVWSLFWEILANLIFAAFARHLSMRNLVLVVAASACAIIATIFVYRSYGDVGFRWHSLYLGPVRIMFPFAAGVLIHRLFQAGLLKWIPGLPVWMLGALLIAALILPVFYRFALEATLLVGVLLILIPAIVASGARTEVSAYWAPVARLSGELSYPVYILHIPIYNLLDCLPFYAGWPVYVRFACALSVIMLASIAASRLYDQPFRKSLAAKLRR